MPTVDHPQPEQEVRELKAKLKEAEEALAQRDEQIKKQVEAFEEAEKELKEELNKAREDNLRVLVADRQIADVEAFADRLGKVRELFMASDAAAQAADVARDAAMSALRETFAIPVPKKRTAEDV
jgi:glutamine synthetase adenylyltransferase